MKRMNSRNFGTTLLLCLVCLSLVFVYPAKPSHAADPIRIGVLFSITGPTGFFGTPSKEGVTAVFDDVNKKGGLFGRKIEYFVEDDQSNPSNAVIATTKLVRDKKVSLIIGPSLTDSGMAMIPIIEKEGVPFVVTGPLVTPFKKWVFLIGPGDVRGASHIMEVAVKNMGGKKIAILRDTSNYGGTASKVYNKEIANYPGSKIIIEEKFEVADTSMVPQLTRIKASNPDVIILHGFAPAASVVAKNCKQLGIKTPVLCCHAVGMPEFVKLSGKIAEEFKWALLVPQVLIAEKLPPSDPYHKVFDPFKKLMKGTYGESKELNIFHGVTVDAASVAVAALRLAGTDDRAAVRNALEKVRYEGLLGPFACSATDHQGSPYDPETPVMIKNGEFWPYEK
jgi:branched-chain amino acid transport system substrate-binding protein